MPTEGVQWFVARIKMSIPWDTILQNLARIGVDGYVPTITQKGYYQGKKITIERPLFPTYGFVAFDRTVTQWSRIINHSVGINHLLPINAEIPTPVPTEFVIELKSRKSAADMIETTRQFAANEIVRFIAGPYATAIDPEQRQAIVLWSKTKVSRVAIKSASRGLIEATVPTGHLAATS